MASRCDSPDKMMKDMRLNTPKGTHDILPQDINKWLYVESIARDVAKMFCCQEIRTPVFEYTELFLRGIGEATDIVSKEMYTFVDKGDRSLTLKPEGTASVARSVVQHSLYQDLPLRLFYITPVFRYENPQKGRYRQHHQFGIELYGESPYMDFEALHFAYTFLDRVGLVNLQILLNSIGCSECRAEYVSQLRSFVKSNLDCFCSVCKARADVNTLRMLDCKNKSCISILQQAPLISDFLCDDCVTHQNALMNQLDSAGMSYKIDPCIVRGLDYYNRTVFEISTTLDTLGNQSTVCGGGRYDDLVQQLGGKPTQCVGFGLGIERLIALLDSQNKQYVEYSAQLTVVCVDSQDVDCAMAVVSRLRKANVSVDIDYTGKSLRSQLKRADKIKSKYVLVVGKDETTSGCAKIRDLSTRQEFAVRLDDTAGIVNVVTSSVSCLQSETRSVALS